MIKKIKDLTNAIENSISWLIKTLEGRSMASKLYLLAVSLFSLFNTKSISSLSKFLVSFKLLEKPLSLSPLYTPIFWSLVGLVLIAAVLLHIQEYRAQKYKLPDEDHWDRVARGVDRPGTRGCFFTGREKALKELVAWLETETSNLELPDRKARVVTGTMGSGKSAVLGRLVACANPAMRASMKKAEILKDAPKGTVPKKGAIAAAIYCRGLNDERIDRAIADQLLFSPDNTITGLRRERETHPSKVIGIVVDALDEAKAEDRNHIIKRLKDLASFDNVRLIVSTRKWKNDDVPMGTESVEIDLDDPEYFCSIDIAKYVELRLLNRKTVYARQNRKDDVKEISLAVARVVAQYEKPKSSFLYAHIVSRLLGEAKQPIDTSCEGWEKEFSLPEILDDAFEEDLDRFDDKQRYVDLLTPLAYSLGKGLPHGLWVKLASKIAGKNYSNSDINNLPKNAGFYIISDNEERHKVYRLFHEAFSEYLKRETCDGNIDRIITDSLIECATPDGSSGLEWEQVTELSDINSYIINYLPAHAAQAKRLDALMADPSFLLAMRTDSLLAEFPKLSSPDGQRAAKSYRNVSHLLRERERRDRTSYLRLSAMQNKAEDISKKLLGFTDQTPWAPVWTKWEHDASSRVIAETEGLVGALAVGENADGEPIVVYGSDQELRVLGLTKNIENKRDMGSSVNALLFLGKGGEKMVVGSWHGGTIRVIDLASLEVKSEQKVDFDNDQDRILCPVYFADNVAVALTGYKGEIEIWSIPDLQKKYRETLKAHEATIHCLKNVVDFDRNSVLVSAAESQRCQERVEEPQIRIFSPPDLTHKKELPRDPKGVAKRVEIIKFMDRFFLLAFFTSKYPTSLELWDLRSESLLAETNSDISELNFLELFALIKEDDIFAVVAGHSRVQFIKLIFSENSSTNGFELAPLHPIDVGSVAHWAGPVTINGRPTLVSANHSIRTWDLFELTEAALQGANSDSYQIETMAVNPETRSKIVATANSDDYSKIWVWIAKDGSVSWSKRMESKHDSHWIRYAAVTQIKGKEVVVIVFRYNEVKLYDIENCVPLPGSIRIRGKYISYFTVQIIQDKPY